MHSHCRGRKFKPCTFHQNSEKPALCGLFAFWVKYLPSPPIFGLGYFRPFATNLPHLIGKGGYVATIRQKSTGACEVQIRRTGFPTCSRTFDSKC
ncbi:DUF6783 domain-containing protein [Herbaspirillum seropedicae]|uniref:DUF6783 domain-containing protein n=1 Tax=Herbaspirillum seropedicae TaxID=964 RepID=UPI003AAFFC24